MWSPQHSQVLARVTQGDSTDLQLGYELKVVEKEVLQQGEGYWRERGAQRETPSQDLGP